MTNLQYQVHNLLTINYRNSHNTTLSAVRFFSREGWPTANKKKIKGKKAAIGCVICFYAYQTIYFHHAVLIVINLK